MKKQYNVIITAGASGIGLETAKAFNKINYNVAICDIDEQAINRLNKTDPDIYTAVCDVSDYKMTEMFIGSTAQKLGGIDTLVNNAGIGGPTGKIEEILPNDWSKCLNVCLGGQFNSIRASIIHLKRSQNPSIINLSSAAGKMGFSMRSPYAAAKWGVIGLTKSLAIELGEYNIRVNAVLPGIVSGQRQEDILRKKAVAKDMTFEQVELEALSYSSIKKYVTASDIANQIIFLANESGKMISGQAISVCGDLKMLS
jgi:NAD(P)-dependent dehydrogenase (short-subunit alcohol dehydrogenase family)